MRKPMVAGNWKMNGNFVSNEKLLAGLAVQAEKLTDLDVAVFPPAVYLQQVKEALRDTGIDWGTQNLSQFDQGAYTGELSAVMLKDFACRYVLIGHSERRCLYAELDLDQHVLDKICGEKYSMALNTGLSPILCIGESLAEYEAGQTEEIIAQLLDIVIAEQGVKALSKAVLAYEPVWAIGTGKTATPEWAQSVHEFMRKRIAKHDEETAAGIQILYGGSVKGDNATPLFSMADIDGGLIGGASLDADEFIDICLAAL